MNVLLGRIAYRRSLAEAQWRRFSGVCWNENIKKIAALLKVKYMPFNKDIETHSSIRLVDDESNKFLGIVEIKKAMYSNKGAGRPEGRGPGGGQRQGIPASVQDPDVPEDNAGEVHQGRGPEGTQCQ